MAEQRTSRTATAVGCLALIVFLGLGGFLVVSWFMGSCLPDIRSTWGEYTVDITDMKDGAPPKAILEVLSKKGGNAEIEVELISKERGEVGRGSASFHFDKGETKQVEVPLHLHGGFTFSGRTQVQYNWVTIYINGKEYSH